MYVYYIRNPHCDNAVPRRLRAFLYNNRVSKTCVHWRLPDGFVHSSVEQWSFNPLMSKYCALSLRWLSYLVIERECKRNNSWLSSLPFYYDPHMIRYMSFFWHFYYRLEENLLVIGRNDTVVRRLLSKCHHKDIVQFSEGIREQIQSLLCVFRGQVSYIKIILYTRTSLMKSLGACSDAQHLI